MAFESYEKQYVVCFQQHDGFVLRKIDFPRAPPFAKPSAARADIDIVLPKFGTMEKSEKIEKIERVYFCFAFSRLAGFGVSPTKQ